MGRQSLDQLEFLHFDLWRWQEDTNTPDHSPSDIWRSLPSPDFQQSMQHATMPRQLCSKHVCKILAGQCRCKCHTGPFYWKPQTWQATNKAFKGVKANVHRGEKRTVGAVYSEKRKDD